MYKLYFQDQPAEYSELGLHSDFRDMTETPNASFEESDTLVLHYESIYKDSYKLKLVPSIKSHKSWCQAWTLLLPVPSAFKMSASKFFHN